MSVHLRFGWIDAGPSPDKLAEATMATLSIEAGGNAVTAVVDRRNGIYSDEIVVPLFSVAEWLVTNWWHIWYEVEDASRQRPEFESRHNLAFAGDGFVLPNLTIVPASSQMQLRWARRKPRHSRVEFVDEGRESVERQHLESEFRNLIDAVLDRLHHRAGTTVAADVLGDAWNAINDLDADERDFSRAAALLGIDPFDVENDVAQSIAEFWEQAEPSVREDALASASASSLTRVGQWLDSALGTLADGAGASEWSDVRQGLPLVAPDAAPWTRGYELARAARDRLGSDGGRFEFVAHGPLAIRRYDTEPPSSRIHALVAAGSPACATAPRGESGRRFLVARALGDYLGRLAAGPGLLSSLATDRQAQSRAFAAEFLAPAHSLRQRLTSDSLDTDEADELGVEFGVSSEVIRHQVQNHDLAEVVS